MICPNCSSTNQTTRFCTECGKEIVRLQPPALPEDGLVGRTIDHKYKIESKLGEGGMGAVYRARRLLISDVVALKILHPDQVANANAVERFQREAQAAARLKHPNVVTVYDFGVSEEGLVYLVMELAEGVSLRELIAQRGTLHQTTAIEVASQVCMALAAAHKREVVHRDIKPENILVQNSTLGMIVKVLDFGVAALRDLQTSRLTQSGTVVGTPFYMSPEHCRGEELDGRSDIYALAVVLYEMLTGALPFDGTTPTAVVVKQVNDAPTPLREINPAITPEVEAVVLRALSKSRDARPQTADAFARDLKTAAASLPLFITSPHRVIARTGTDLAPLQATTQQEEAASTDAAPPPAVLAHRGWGWRAPLALAILLAGLGAALYFARGWYLRRITVDANSAVARQTPTPAPSTLAIESPKPAPSPTPSDALWEVVAADTANAENAQEALGGPDQKMAVIKPGGQLALAYRAGKFFGNGPGADVTVHGRQEGPVSYLIFVRDESSQAWQRIDVNRGGFPRGHDMGHHGVAQARQIAVRNQSPSDLSLDAITIAYKEQTSGAPAHHHAAPKTVKR